MKSPWTTNGSRHFLDNGDDVWGRWISTPCGLRGFSTLCSPTKRNPRDQKTSKIGLHVEGSKHQPLKDWMLPAPFEGVFVSLQTKSCYYEKDTSKKTWLFKGAKAHKKHSPGIETFGPENDELNR